MSKKHFEIIDVKNLSVIYAIQAREHLRSQTQLFPILRCLSRKQPACICLDI